MEIVAELIFGLIIEVDSFLYGFLFAFPIALIRFFYTT